MGAWVNPAYTNKGHPRHLKTSCDVRSGADGAGGKALSEAFSHPEDYVTTIMPEWDEIDAKKNDSKYSMPRSNKFTTPVTRKISVGNKIKELFDVKIDGIGTSPIGEEKGEEEVTSGKTSNKSLRVVEEDLEYMEESEKTQVNQENKQYYSAVNDYDEFLVTSSRPPNALRTKSTSTQVKGQTHYIAGHFQKQVHPSTPTILDDMSSHRSPVSVTDAYGSMQRQTFDIYESQKQPGTRKAENVYDDVTSHRPAVEKDTPYGGVHYQRKGQYIPAMPASASKNKQENIYDDVSSYREPIDKWDSYGTHQRRVFQRLIPKEHGPTKVMPSLPHLPYYYGKSTGSAFDDDPSSSRGPVSIDDPTYDDSIRNQPQGRGSNHILDDQASLRPPVSIEDPTHTPARTRNNNSSRRDIRYSSVVPPPLSPLPRQQQYRTRFPYHSTNHDNTSLRPTISIEDPEYFGVPSESDILVHDVHSSLSTTATTIAQYKYKYNDKVRLQSMMDDKNSQRGPVNVDDPYGKSWYNH